MAPAEFTAAPMGKPQADALVALGRVFRLSGWSMRCRACQRHLPITRDGDLMEHLPACPFFGEQHPWARLRAIINDAEAAE